MWSLGCVILELLTGKMSCVGKDNKAADVDKIFDVSTREWLNWAASSGACTATSWFDPRVGLGLVEALSSNKFQVVMSLTCEYP